MMLDDDDFRRTRDFIISRYIIDLIKQPKPRMRALEFTVLVCHCHHSFCYNNPAGTGCLMKCRDAHNEGSHYQLIQDETRPPGHQTCKLPNM